MQLPKVLVVDDAADMRLVISRALKEAGFPYEEARTGEEGIAKLVGDYDIKLVLLDLLLPDIDGITFLKRTIDTRLERDLRVCIISGKRDRATVADAIQNGANDYVVKPIYPEALIAKIRSLFKLGAATDQYNQIVTNLKAKLHNTEVHPDLLINTVSEIGIALQSSASFEVNYQMALSCELLTNAIGLTSVFNCRVVSCAKQGFGKYTVMANFSGIGEDVSSKIRGLAIRGEKITDNTIEKSAFSK